MKYEPDSLFDLPFEPDLICVSYGCNDLYQAATTDLNVEYEKAAAYLAKLKAMYPRAKCLANTPLRHPYCQSDPFFAEKFDRYRETASQLIPAAGYTLVDGLSLVPAGERYFAEDGIHLSADGNLQYAHRLLTILENE